MQAAAIVPHITAHAGETTQFSYDKEWLTLAIKINK